MTNDLRDAVKGRGRLGDFAKTDLATDAEIFAHAGYGRIANMRKMQQIAMTFSISILRKMAGKNRAMVGVRLVLCLLEVSHTKMKNAKDPVLKKYKYRLR